MFSLLSIGEKKEKYLLDELPTVGKKLVKDYLINFSESNKFDLSYIDLDRISNEFMEEDKIFMILSKIDGFVEKYPEFADKLYEKIKDMPNKEFKYFFQEMDDFGKESFKMAGFYDAKGRLIKEMRDKFNDFEPELEEFKERWDILILDIPFLSKIMWIGIEMTKDGEVYDYDDDCLSVVFRMKLFRWYYKLRRETEALKEKQKTLNKEISLIPGGLGFKKAQEHFEVLSSEIDNI